MEKYGVLETDDGVKTGQVAPGKVCPKCGGSLKELTTTNVRICPKCGSLPFEGTP